MGVQTAGRLLTNCPPEHPSFLQYQIFSTKECYRTLETFLCPCDAADQNSEVQHQDDVSEVLPTTAEAGDRTRCVGAGEISSWSLVAAEPEGVAGHL